MGLLKFKKTVNNTVVKKLAVFIFLIAILCLCSVLPKQSIFDLQNVKAVSFVADVQDAQNLGLQYTPNGSDAIIEVEPSAAAQIYQSLQPKSTIMTLESEQINALKNYLNMTNSYTQTLQDKTIIYGYTSKFNQCEFVDGKKINVQIVVDEYQILVGFPMIMTGF